MTVSNNSAPPGPASYPVAPTSNSSVLASSEFVRDEIWRPGRRLNWNWRTDDLQNQLQKFRGVPKTPVTTKKKPVLNGGTPLQLLSIAATQTAYVPPGQADRVYSLVSVTFTRDGFDQNYGGVNIWFKGYKGNTQWQEMTNGSDSPVNFIAEATKETVQVKVQPVGLTGIPVNFSLCPTTSVTLSGQVGAPPAPTVSQNVVPIVGGFQFIFNIEGGLLQDVIQCYKVYRNTANTTSGATIVKTIPQPQTNDGTYVVQDHAGGDSIYFYWVSAVNTSGLESTLTAAQGSTQSALTTQTGFGKNLLPNPGFEFNSLGLSTSTILGGTAGIQQFIDGWQIFNSNSQYVMRLDTSRVHSGGQSAAIWLGDNQSVPNGTTYFGQIWSTTFLPIAIGDIVRVSGWLQGAQAGVTPGGVTFSSSLVLAIYAADGSVAGYLTAGVTPGNGSMQFVQSALQIPATIGGKIPSYGRFLIGNSVANASGSTFNTSTGKFYNYVAYDDIKVVLQSTAFDLTPLNTTLSDTSVGAILSQHSGSSHQIDVAGFTVQYGDGQVSYNSGSTDPGSFGTYYVYFSDPTYSGGSVTYTTTQSAYTLTSGNGIIFIGKITTVNGTPGSGGGGGGGTSRGGCFTPNTKIKTTNGPKNISSIRPRDLVLTENGFRPVHTVLIHAYNGELRDMGNDEGVTPGHHIRQSGDWKPAGDKFPKAYQYEGDVWNLHIDSDDPADHNFVLENGETAHNFMKP